MLGPNPFIDVSSSTFVIVSDMAGIPGFGDIVNAVMEGLTRFDRIVRRVWR